MASGEPQSGPLTDLAQQAASKAEEIGRWLENREPSDVLEEVKRFARRRPVMFLGLSALAGIVVGRLARGAVAANTSLDSPDSGSDKRALTYVDVPLDLRVGGLHLDLPEHLPGDRRSAADL